MFSLSLDCSLKNLFVPKIDASTEEVSMSPAELSSSTEGKSESFCILKWFKKMGLANPFNYNYLRFMLCFNYFASKYYFYIQYFTY